MRSSNTLAKFSSVEMLAHLGMCDHLVVVRHVRSAVTGHQTVTVKMLRKKHHVTAYQGT